MQFHGAVHTVGAVAAAVAVRSHRVFVVQRDLNVL